MIGTVHSANSQTSGRMSGFRNFIPAGLTPVEYAAKLRRDEGKNFTEELEAHLLHGFVFSTPDAFLMGKPCPRGVWVHDAWETWAPEACNAWFVWLAVGDAWRLMDFMPYTLPWVGFYRQGRDWTEIHWLPSALLHRRIHGFKSALDFHLKD